MEGIFPFQRINTTATLTTSAGGPVSTTVTVPANCQCEIVNIDTSNAAVFTFTPNTSATTVTVASTARVIPALGIMYERLPQGCYAVSAQAVAGTPILRFTPGLA